MSARRVPLLALAALLLASCTQRSAEARPDSGTAFPPGPTKHTADEDSLQALGRRWLGFVGRRDSVAIGALFADDGVSFAPNQPPARGPAGVAAAYGALYRMGDDVQLTFASTLLSVAASGDLAVDRGTYQLSWSANGKRVTDHGNYVTVLRKVDGRWKVADDIFASEVPMPGM